MGQNFHFLSPFIIIITTTTTIIIITITTTFSEYTMSYPKVSGLRRY
jgi:hypothetical protein